MMEPTRPRRCAVWSVVLALALCGLAGLALAEDAPPAPPPESSEPPPPPAPEPPRLAPGIVEGVVQIKGAREPVAQARVKLSGTELTAVTDAKGRFKFPAVPTGDYTLTVEEGTLKPYAMPVSVLPGETTTVKCYVFRLGYSLDEVVVVGKKEPEQTARQEISKEELSGVPGANNDVFRVVENLPGVAATPFGGGFSEGLVIRGTSPENSLYLFNDFTIPQLFHFGGLISVINAELIDDIVYYPGGFGVKYGQALGGVIDVVSRSPRSDRFGGVVDLSTYSSFVMFEGPVGDQFRWAGTVRRSFIDFVLPAVVPKDQLEFTLAPTFYDYTAIFECEPNGANRLRATFVGSDDRLAIVGATDNNDPFSGNSFDMTIDWHQATVRWDATPTAGLVNTMAVNALYYDSVVNFGRGLSVESVVLSPDLRDDFSVRLGSWNELRLGGYAGYGDLDLKLNVVRPPKEGHPAISVSSDQIVERNYDLGTYGAGAYVDDVMKPAAWVELIPGVRGDYSAYLEKATADPRLLLRFHPTPPSTIKAAAGVYHQWPQGDEMAKGIGNPQLDAEVAYEGVLGFDYDFGQGWTIDAQGYYKALDDLVSPTEADDRVPYRNTGIGHVYGGELLARKKLTDRLFGWLSYTYSVSERRDAPGVEWRYFDQDQRHNFIILANYSLGENKQWRLGGKWQFSTGLPYTKIDGAIYNADTDSYSPIYSDEINGRREQAYHQLDVRVDKLWIFDSWTLNTYLDVQNVYWSQYPFGYRYNFDYSERRPVSFPAFMPSIGLDARF